MCSCFLVGLVEQCPYEEELQNLHLDILTPRLKRLALVASIQIFISLAPFDLYTHNLHLH